MRIEKFAVFVTSFVLALASLSPGPARAQVNSAGPAVQNLASNPIGKVVTATGSVKIERANAMVVLANVAGQAGQAKVGDLVYLGDVVATGADGRVGINFTDGSSFNLSNNARMALDKFVYDPDGTSNSTLFNVTKGTITFVAGKVAKTGDMKVDTPSQLWEFEAPRRTSKFWMMGRSGFLPLLNRVKVSSRKSRWRRRRRNLNKKPSPSSTSVEAARVIS